MCIPLAAAVLGAAIIGGGVAMYQGSKARAQARAAQEQNVQMAEQQAQRAEEASNRLNQKQPGIAQLWDRNMKAASKGIGSSFLTGNSGVPNLTSYLGGAPTVLGA